MSTATAPTSGATPGQEAFDVAQQYVGTPYVWGGSSPSTGFDCSGLTSYSYMAGAGINITRTVATQWNNNTTLQTVYDITQTPGTPNVSDLQVGDLIIYLAVGAGGSSGHVQMYAGNNNIIEAPETGEDIHIIPCTFNIGSADPFRGIKRASGQGGSPVTASTGGSSNQGTGNQGASNAGNPTTSQVSLSTLAGQIMQNLPDPRSNLPFSAFFLGQKVPGPAAGRSGSLQISVPGVKGNLYPNTTLVRGGIVELGAMGSTAPNAPLLTRPGGPFRCYFMMNPSSISFDTNVDTSILAPSQQSPQAMAMGSYLVTQESVSFSVIFNRMYEVWQGNVPGPSDVGCAWDIRALERLMGMYDATQVPGSPYNTTTGTGLYGAGGNPPVALPIQVVFGGANSIQFQGQLVQLDYTYTLFDSNMVPIEAEADIGVMRLYNPTLTCADLVNLTVNQYGLVGSTPAPSSTATFNNPVGQGGQAKITAS
jgi:hypothetical protein